MKRTLLLACLFLNFEGSLFSALNYTESNLSVAFAYNTTPTIMGELAAGIDDGYTNPYPIGFNFQFGSVVYTEFIASSNGWMSFNLGVIGSDPANQLAGNATQTANSERPIIAPLWDDLDVSGSGGNANYKLTGSAPNRVLTVEWKNMMWKNSALGPVISFQVKLYETSNIIDFCYKAESSAVSSGSASIGLEGPSGTDYYCLTNTTATPGVNHNASEVTTISARPATNQVYRWTNNVTPTPIELIYFKGAEQGNSNILEWATATETNNDFFSIERSADGLSYISILTMEGAGNSSCVLKYRARDEQSLKGVNYYRLKQTDYDGKFSYSNVVALKNDVVGLDISIYPNPASGEFRLHSADDIPIQIKIYDQTGKLVEERTLEDRELLFGSDYSPGIYFISCSGGGQQTQVLRVIRN
jgi:hypothetical protein